MKRHCIVWGYLCQVLGVNLQDRKLNETYVSLFQNADADRSGASAVAVTAAPRPSHGVSDQGNRG